MRKSGTSVSIRDVHSTNGTTLNGKLLHAYDEYQLHNKDIIAVGKTSLRFVHDEHGPSCGKEIRETNSIQKPRLWTPATSVSTKKLLKQDSIINKRTVSISNEPDRELAPDELVMKPFQKINSAQQDAEKKGEKCLDGSTLEIATCAGCQATIGHLELLKQQAHLNECLGGRMASTKNAGSKTFKRNKPLVPICVKKTKKTKASEENTKDVAGKVKQGRKRKRVMDTNEHCELIVAPSLTKEQQTERQLAVATKKLVQLDEQVAKLAKKRKTLVKSIERLEKMKIKLQKSQILPPATVRKLLNLQVAFKVLFPRNCEANPIDFREKNKRVQYASLVAKRYAPSRWKDREKCHEKEQKEIAAIATISMWARASQQRFACDAVLLYCNTIFRRYVDRNPVTNAEVLIQGKDVGASNSFNETVPDVVKRVFLNWQHDIALLQELQVEELERGIAAIETKNLLADAALSGNLISNLWSGSCTEENEASNEIKSTVDIFTTAKSTEEDMRLAWEYMATVIKQLIDRKRVCVDSVDVPEKEAVS